MRVPSGNRLTSPGEIVSDSKMLLPELPPERSQSISALVNVREIKFKKQFLE